MFDIEIEPNAGANQSETIGNSDASEVTFPYDLDNSPVVPGSLTVTAGSVSGSDDSDGGISGTGISSGSIDYATGDISVTFAASVANNVPVTAAFKSWEVDSRDVKDLGNVPSTFHLRNYDEDNSVLVEVSEDRANWTTVHNSTIKQWNIPPIGRTSVRFARVLATKKCRIFGGPINLQ